jgi:hypothetical protein
MKVARATRRIEVFIGGLERPSPGEGLELPVAHPLPARSFRGAG